MRMRQHVFKQFDKILIFEYTRCMIMNVKAAIWQHEAMRLKIWRIH